ncbi:hypothetical protein EG835_06795, partial [bacterium]|nr:hypothetical protein [bacterium]
MHGCCCAPPAPSRSCACTPRRRAPASWTSCLPQDALSCWGHDERLSQLMRVTMVNKYYPPHLGGIEYHMRDLATALVQRGVDVRAIVSNESGEVLRETVDGVDVVRMARSFAYASTPVVPGMARALRVESQRAGAPDLFHLHFPYPWGEVAWLRARVHQPTVLAYHSDIVRQKALLAAYAPVL